MILLAAIHGILTRQSDASWPDRLDAWMAANAPQIRVIKKEYAAGPFPRWNCWVKDPLLARGLAAEIELFLKQDKATKVWLVAHSNGAVIALRAASLLIYRGYSIGGLILTGAACEADISKNGVLDWWAHEQLGAAIAYSSPMDLVLDGDPAADKGWLRRLKAWIWGRAMWPYGTLGKTGWMWQGMPLAQEPLRNRISTAAGVETVHSIRVTIIDRVFTGGHCGYWVPARIDHTFERILQDISHQ